MPERAFFVSREVRNAIARLAVSKNSKISMFKITAFGLLLNLFQIAIAAAPATPIAIGREALAEATSLVVQTPFESNHKVIDVTITAYTLRTQETDSSPCHTATGYNACENPDDKNVIAANFLPIGAKLMIPRFFGTKVFEVQDRMNARFDGTHTVDVLFVKDSPQETLAAARNFGRRTASIVVLED
jgi:3D (Asp-Asp-Asp) domain-containing protein